MAEIKVGTTVAPVKVRQNEKVTWEVAGIGPTQWLKVVVTSFYKMASRETIIGKGLPGSKTVERTMQFVTWDKDVTLFHSLYLVTPPSGEGIPTESKVGTENTPGLSLVIDDIGKPPGLCPDEDRDRFEEKELAAPSSRAHRESDR